MKKVVVCLMVFAMGIAMEISFLQAASSPSKNVAVNAVVPNRAPVIDITILKFTDGNPDNNPWTGSEVVTTMTFGDLVYEFTGDTGESLNAGLLYAQAAFCVVVYTQSFGHRYEVKSTSGSLISGSNRLPDGTSPYTGSCFGLSPVYSADDEWRWPGGSAKQGPMPTGATLGSAGSAIVSNKLIYGSEPAGSARILQAYYSLPPKKADGSDPFTGFQAIPLEQAPGTYTTTVTISITAI